MTGSTVHIQYINIGEKIHFWNLLADISKSMLLKLKLYVK